MYMLVYVCEWGVCGERETLIMRKTGIFVFHSSIHFPEIVINFILYSRMKFCCVYISQFLYPFIR